MKKEHLDPIGECFWCNEAIYPDKDNDILVIEGNNKEFLTCGDKKCLEAIGIELEWDKDYRKLDSDLKFYEFVDGRGMTYKHIPTEEELKLHEADLKLEEKWLKERGLA